MSKKKESFEKKLTSIRPITIAMIFVMMPIAIEMSFLFNIFLESVVTIDYVRYIASIFVGIAIGSSMMLASIHSDLIEDLRIKVGDDSYLSIPEAFYLLSFIGMLILFRVPEAEGSTFGWYFGRVFGAITYATVEYIFSKLFINKYKHEKEKYNPNKNKQNG